MGHKVQLSRLCFFSVLSWLFLCQLASASLLLGQLLTGTKYDRAIEIRNAGRFSEAVNLTQYGLLWLPNGQDMRVSTWSQLKAPISTESVLVPGGGSYVVAHSRAAPWLVANADALSENFLFDGDDVVALAIRTRNGTWLPVDIVGDPKQYNQSGWPVAGVANATQNHTLFRKTIVTSPTVNWTLSAGTDARSSQWLVLLSSEFLLGGSNSTETLPPTGGQCTNATGGARDRRRDRSTLKIATWTLDWLFDGVDDPEGSPWNNGDTCPGNPGDADFVPLNRCDSAGAQARIDRVASRIRALDADIVHVVEVESCEVLQQLVNGSDARYASYLSMANDTASYRNLGLLTRLDPNTLLKTIPGNKSYPLPGSACRFSGDGTTDVKTSFWSTFQAFNMSVTFIGVQLPGSALDPETCAVREAQAALISDEVGRQLDAGREVVVAGNLNDWSGTDPDSLGHVPISRALQILQRPNASRPFQLTNAATRLPRAERYTAKSPSAGGGSPSLQQVDFVLLTKGLASLNVTVQIAHDNNTLQSLSSHWPLVVTLQLPVGNTTATTPATIGNITAVNNTSPSILVPAFVPTSTIGSTTKHREKLSKLVLPVVLGCVGVVLVTLSALLALILVRRRNRVHSHRRLQKRTQVEESDQLRPPVIELEQGSTEEVEQQTGDIDKPLNEWRPIDRTMPTIKSGEILELGLYSKSLFEDDD